MTEKITTKSWKELRAKLDPEVLAEADRLLKEDLQQMLLAQIRKLAGLTQEDLADSLGVSQAQVSKLERQDNVQLDTLRRIVEALGGDLEIVVNLPTGRIALSQFKHQKAA